MSAAEQRRLLTVEDVATRCSLGETAAREVLRRAGGYKLGGTWRIEQADLERYLQTLRATAASRREASCGSTRSDQEDRGSTTSRDPTGPATAVPLDAETVALLNGSRSNGFAKQSRRTPTLSLVSSDP